MQTFLPYKDFEKSAEVLDNRRLGKQRVEAYQILKTLVEERKAWSNHPAVKMWKGYESALACYGCRICDEWIKRGFKDTCKLKIWMLWAQTQNPYEIVYPHWLDEKFIISHRSNLLRKNRDYYSQFNWKVSDDLPYVWPI